MIFSLAEALIETWRCLCGSPRSRRLSDIGLSRAAIEFGRRPPAKRHEMGSRPAPAYDAQGWVAMPGEKR